MSGKKNKSIKAKTTEMSPEALEAIRNTEKTFKPKKMEPDKPISEKDKKDIGSLIKNAKFGGMNAVPSKYEGFSKLPEDVQDQMNPTLAKEFEKRGVVKMGKGGAVCKGMGIARAGGKFKLR